MHLIFFNNQKKFFRHFYNQKLCHCCKHILTTTFLQIFFIRACYKYSYIHVIHLFLSLFYLLQKCRYIRTKVFLHSYKSVFTFLQTCVTIFYKSVFTFLQTCVTIFYILIFVTTKPKQTLQTTTLPPLT